MSVTRKQIAQGAVSPGKLHNAVRSGTYLYDDFRQQLRASKIDGYTPPTGANGDINFLYSWGGTYLYYVRGAATILAPFLDSTNGGMTASLDNVAAEGIEYVPGAMQSARNPYGATIGHATLGGDIFIKVTLRLTTVANAAECAVGFRKAETGQALIDDYDEAAWLNIQAGVVRTETILNNGATTTAATGVTATDATNITLEARTRGRYVDFYVNGVRKQPAATEFRFDSGEVIVPFIHFLQGAAGTPLNISLIECGKMADVYDSLVSQ